MKTLSIDIETYSSNDLHKGGVYKYAEADDFEILLFAYSIDSGPVEVIDLIQGQAIPVEVVRALTDPAVLKTAYNANFERVCIARAMDTYLPPEQWECTMVRAACAGLPLSLDAVAKVLDLETQKDSKGKALIRYFSVPCRATRTNGMRTRNLPMHDPFRWMDFIEYCRRDVEVEMAVRAALSFIQIPDFEHQLWCIDQRINDRGVRIDTDFVYNAVEFDRQYLMKLKDEAAVLTGLENTNSPAQLKEWLSEQTGEEVTALTKASVSEMLDTEVSKDVKRMLEIRQEMAKTSTKKYVTMLDAACKDDRIRGLLQFYGANRTGRWAGRLVQVQNLPRNYIKDLLSARNLVKENEEDLFELLYGNVPDTLSQLIRTAFVPMKDHVFIVADFSAIEARVIAWLADEKWRMEVFAGDGKIYEASAAQMFDVPVESIGKDSPLRQKGKVAELALGYQGGPGALKAMGALEMGIHESELRNIVHAWRKASPMIVKLWEGMETAATDAVSKHTQTEYRGILFRVENDYLFITLPSGRNLSYKSPRLKEGRYGGSVLTYEGLNQTTRKWQREETYGGKITENVVQAIARDCLAVAMSRLHGVGHRIVMHIHDEVVLEYWSELADVDEVCQTMGLPISWAPGLQLTADGFVTDFYMKD